MAPQHGVSVKFSSAWEGGTKYILEACRLTLPTPGLARQFLQFVSGAIAFRCLHNSCQGNEWQHLRELKEPGYKDRQKTELKQAPKPEPETIVEDEPEEQAQHYRTASVCGA